jgi:hypothetical protein
MGVRPHAPARCLRIRHSFSQSQTHSILTPLTFGGQGGPLTAAQLRAMSAAFVNGVTSKSVTVDGRPVPNIVRIRSIVFAVALPGDNVFNAPCIAAGLGSVPAGIYSPAVDDGFYVRLAPLPPGTRTVHITAQNPSQSFAEDVTYNLTVVPVSLQ